MLNPLHRVRFSWNTDRHIEIEWVKGRGVPEPELGSTPFSFAEREGEPDQFALNGVPAICWRNDIAPLFEPFQLRENTEYFLDIALPITRAEAENRAKGNPAWPFNDRLASTFRADPPRRWRESAAGTIVVSGQLRLKNHAGILDLNTDFDTPLMAEVVCRKIDYLTEFKALLDEVSDELAELLLQYDSPLSFSFNLSDLGSESDAALLFQMRHIMSPQNLPVAVDEVLSRFHSRLTDRLVVEPIGSVQEPQIDALVDELDVSVLDRGGPLARLFRGYTPREVAVAESDDTVDTVENRYVKYFLEECALIAEQLADRLAKRKKPAAAREARDWVGRIEEMLGHRQWSSVGTLRQFPSNSQVLQRRRGYRDILKFDLALRLSLELSWRRGDDFADGLLGDVRPVNEIYEYWCFFVMRRILVGMCEAELPGNGSFIQVAADGLQVRLEKGRRSRISFLYKQTGTRRLQICLFYNRRFRRPSRALATWDGSYTAYFDPDYSILLTASEGDQKRRHWLHFDAKYRLENSEIEELFAAHDLPDSSLTDDEETTAYDREIARLHKRDDLFKMHTYRDGILSSRGAYILFPGTGTELRFSGAEQNLFVRHPSAFAGKPLHQFPGVGAFDLCPGHGDVQSGMIERFLKTVFEAVLNGGTYQEETGLF
jgi:predicted component of viral defense system (DUF524 family)